MDVHSLLEKILLKILDVLTLICGIFIYIYIYLYQDNVIPNMDIIIHTYIVTSLTNNSQMQANEGTKEVMKSVLL